MENKTVKDIKEKIEERLGEFANIQPKKDALKYLAKCEELSRAYYVTRSTERRHSDKLGVDIVASMFEDVLKKIEQAFEEEY